MLGQANARPARNLPALYPRLPLRLCSSVLRPVGSAGPGARGSRLLRESFTPHPPPPASGHRDPAAQSRGRGWPFLLCPAREAPGAHTKPRAGGAAEGRASGAAKAREQPAPPSPAPAARAASDRGTSSGRGTASPSRGDSCTEQNHSALEMQVTLVQPEAKGPGSPSARPKADSPSCARSGPRAHRTRACCPRRDPNLRAVNHTSALLSFCR